MSAAGFTQLVARALGGSGSFEATLAVLGFGIGIASLWTAIHDVVTTFFGFVGALDQRAYEDAMSSPTPYRTMLWVLMIAYLISFLLLFTRGVMAAHGLRTRRAALAGIVGFLVYQTVFVLFNR